MTGNYVLNGLFGLYVGDALGLPVQLASRAERKRNPVSTMYGYDVFNMSPGIWSDDSSLTFFKLKTSAIGTILMILERGLSNGSISQSYT